MVFFWGGGGWGSANIKLNSSVSMPVVSLQIKFVTYTYSPIQFIIDANDVSGVACMC